MLVSKNGFFSNLLVSFRASQVPRLGIDHSAWVQMRATKEDNLAGRIPNPSRFEMKTGSASKDGPNMNRRCATPANCSSLYRGSVSSLRRSASVGKTRHSNHLCYPLDKCQRAFWWQRRRCELTAQISHAHPSFSNQFSTSANEFGCGRT